MKIVFIGAGNIASNLSKYFAKKGNKITQVISRNASHASALAQLLNCSFSNNIKEIDTNADLYFVCVNDDQIPFVIKELPTLKGLILHTSGSTSISIFKDKFKHYGVFYPLQTFSKFKEVNLSNVAVFIETGTDEDEQKLRDFCSGLSNMVQVTNFEQRLAIHICGVFANNFSNHMYTLAYTLSKQYNIPFHVLFPLITETADKIKHRSPSASQTGPAVRNDLNTLNKHRKFLSDKPELLEIYNKLTESIIKFSH